MSSQPLILAPTGRIARFHVFELTHSDLDPTAQLRLLADQLAGKTVVVGLGAPLVARLAGSVAGLRPFPALSGTGVAAASTQGALWCGLSGDDRGVLLHESRAIQRVLGPSFRMTELVDTFTHLDGRDLTGYLDGTENPQGEAAARAALIAGAGDGLDGGSFVAVQRWVHDLDRFGRWPGDERDHVIGRSRQTNEELEGAPASAHVKRTAQERFDPPAFMLRRSMPYVAGRENGLYFVAYGQSLDRYERVLRRMLGLEDGVTDALFRFTRPVTGGYYFCPPLRHGRVDLRQVGL